MMGWRAPATASLCQDEVVGSYRQELSMAQARAIGLDLGCFDFRTVFPDGFERQVSGRIFDIMSDREIV